MQDRPDKATLLDAVALFLTGEVQPALEEDKRLAFRVLIAANLAQVVAAEIRGGEGHDAAELDRLRALLPDFAAAGLARPALGDALRALNRELAARLRDGRLHADALAGVREHLCATLRDALSIANPRFDLSEEIE